MFATIPFPLLIPFHVRLVFFSERLPHFVFRGAFRLGRRHQRRNEGRPGKTVDPSWTPLQDPAVTFGRRDIWPLLNLSRPHLWPLLNLVAIPFVPRYICAPLHWGTRLCYIWSVVTCGPRYIWAPIHLALVTFWRR